MTAKFKVGTLVGGVLCDTHEEAFKQHCFYGESITNADGSEISEEDEITFSALAHEQGS